MTHISGKFNGNIPACVSTIRSLQNYDGFGNDNQPVVIGPECEFFIAQRSENNRLKSITELQAAKLKEEYKARTGKALEQEAIHSHFELNFAPTSLDHFRENEASYQAYTKKLYHVASEIGQRIVPSSHGPHIGDVNDIHDQLTRRDRIQILVPNGQKYLGDELIVFANGTAGIHDSRLYQDPERLYEGLRRAYYTSPVLYAATNNGFPYWQGMKEGNGINPRLAAIENYARLPTGRTGTDPLFFTATDGEDFLNLYIERLISAPLLGYYPETLTDEEKRQGLTAPPLHSIEELEFTNGNPPSFADLEKLGLNTEKNLKFAASCFWFGVKLADVAGLDSRQNGNTLKRLERRIGNSGIWQLSTTVLESALLTGHKECGEELDLLLEDFGFGRDGPAHDPQSGIMLSRAMTAAANTSGKVGLAFSYGHYTALDFQRQYISILNKYAEKHGLKDVLEPLHHIAETNRTDAQVLADLCKTPQDIAGFIQNYNIEAITDPRKNFDMMHEAGELYMPAPNRTLVSIAQNFRPQ